MRIEWRKCFLTGFVGFLLLLVGQAAFAAEASGPAPEGNASSDLSWSINDPGDLDFFRLFWGIDQSTTDDGQLDIPATDNSVTGHTITLTGNVGDTIEVFYWMRAHDTSGNISDRSNVVSKIFTVTDTIPPDPPVLQFGLPVTLNCVQPNGAECGLVELASNP